MSRFLNYFLPSGVGAAGVLAGAYIVADQFVVDMPAPAREWVAPVVAQDATPQPAPAPAVMTPTEGAVVARAGYGLGRPALPEEIAAWDIDVRPDGLGLPPGSGDVFTGEELFVENCAMCHGDFGEAVGRWPVLAGGQGTLTREDPVKTIGSYWPYLSTVWDYVHRAMPFGNAQSLSPDEVYAITAYLLYLNDVVDDEFTLSNENFLEVRLPNEENFYMDDRAETELTVFTRPDICMENCKDTVEITMRARVLDVTPETEADASGIGTETAAATETAAVETAPAAPAPEAAPAADPAPVEMAAAGPDPEMVAAGERQWRKCQACHQVGEGAVNRTGPELNDLVGRTIGSVEGFRYSNSFTAAHDAGEVWTEEHLVEFLKNPRGVMPGTKMSFAGFRSDEEALQVLAYITAQSP